MAEEYGIKLKVTADTAEAQREMDKLLEQKSRRVQEAAAAASGEQPSGAAGGSPAASSVSARSGGYASEIGRASRNAGRLQAQSFNREAQSATPNLGRAIGKAAAGIILHQGIGAAFQFARRAGGDNTNLDRAQGAMSGAVQYGTMGAMMGGPAGAAIGALVGGITGLVSRLGEERQRANQVREGMYDNAANLNGGALGSLGATAKSRLLDWQGSREARISWLSSNAEDLTNRTRTAQARMNELAGSNPESREFKYAQAEYQRLSQAMTSANVELMNEKMTPLYDPYSAKEVGDGFSARGLNVGPQVDIQSANDKVIEQQSQMVDLLQKLVDLSNEGVEGANGNNLAQAYRSIGALK